MKYTACAVLALTSALFAQDHPTASEIAARLAAADDARSAKLQDYAATRQYSLVNQRFGVKAGMKVHMTFHAPGPKNFEVLEQSGPSPIRSKVFRRMLDTEQKASSGAAKEGARISPQNYNFQFVETRMYEGRKTYVLEISPKTDNPVLFLGKVYVDAEDYAIAYMDGSPAQNPSFWLKKTVITQKYQKVGAFWLPVLNSSNSDVRVFGHSELRIEYAGYQVNPPHIAVASGQ